MKLSQRLWNESTNKQFYDEVLALIQKHPGSCDDVWLTTAVGYPSREEHKRYAAELCGVAEKFRAAGISVSLQVANTLGHGLYMCTYDCTGLVYDGSPVEHMVGADGTAAELSFCPRGKHFRAYIAETLSYYAPIQPQILWVDDDFRLPNHKPVEFGCFCEDCLAAFNARYGASFSREDLVREILYAKDTAWRERWLRFQREGMEELMRCILQDFCAQSPHTVGGLQHAAPGGYIMGDHEFGFAPMQRITGKAPVSRPGGGTYNDHTPHRFVEKGIDVAFQNARLPQYVKEIYPEVENIPHYAYGKSAEGTALESAYYLACGANNMSYSMLKYAEPLAYYGKFLRLFAAQRPYWERLAAANDESLPAGLCYFVSRDAWQRPLAPGEGLAKLHGTSPYGADQFFRDAIPVVFDERCDNVYLLHPDEAARLSARDIEYLLTQRVVTDGEALAQLIARGVEIGVEARVLSLFESLPLYERYTDHALNAGEQMWKSSYFARGKKECSVFTVHTENAEILGTYAANVPQKPLTDDPATPLGVAELVVTTKQGGRWALLGYQPWKGIISKARRDHLLDLADYVAKVPTPARVVTPHQAILHPRVDEGGKTVCVSVTNCSIGKCEDAALLIRNPKGKRFVFMAQYLPTVELEARREGDAYILALPTLDAWTQGTVFCEE